MTRGTFHRMIPWVTFSKLLAAFSIFQQYLVVGVATDLNCKSDLVLLLKSA